MNESSGLNEQNILSNFDVLNQGLVDATVQENVDLNGVQPTYVQNRTRCKVM